MTIRGIMLATFFVAIGSAAIYYGRLADDADRRFWREVDRRAVQYSDARLRGRFIRLDDGRLVNGLGQFVDEAGNPVPAPAPAPAIEPLKFEALNFNPTPPDSNDAADAADSSKLDPARR